MQLKTQSSWQIFFDHSDVPVMVCQCSTASIYESNEQCLELFGYDTSFLKKSFFSDFLVANNPEEWTQQLLLFTTGIAQKWETKILSKSHEIKSVEIKIVALPDSEDLCLVICKEVQTEDERLTALKKKLQFYETILMEMPTEFAVLSSKWQYLFVNRNSIKDTEFREWMIGKTDYDFCRYRNRDFSIAENRHKQYRELARTKTGKEWVDEHVTNEGVKKYILRQLYPYFIDGKLNMNFGFGIDITERINAEKEREKLLKEMTAQNEELKQFAYITSHDLKEPLRTISGFTSILKRKYSSSFDEKGLEYLQFVIDSANRMGDLLTGLKSFVTLDLDRINKLLVEIDTQSVIEDAINNLKLKILETQAVISVPSTFPLVKGHPQYLTQLFQNLMLNAIKFCKNTPEIKVSWEDQEDYIQFAIQDNGIGVNPAFKEKIFGIFNRLDKKNYEGTGMGLAICKKVVQLHQGTMWVESDGANGSTFFFTIKK